MSDCLFDNVLVKARLLAMEPIYCDIDELTGKQLFTDAMPTAFSLQNHVLADLENLLRGRWLSFTLFSTTYEGFQCLLDRIVPFVELLNEGICKVLVPSDDYWVPYFCMTRTFTHVLEVGRALAGVCNAKSVTFVTFCNVGS